MIRPDRGSADFGRFSAEIMRFPVRFRPPNEFRGLRLYLAEDESKVRGRGYLRDEDDSALRHFAVTA
jgi:hypothetical protein